MSCHVWLIVWIALTLMFIGGAVDYTRDYLADVAPGMSQSQVLAAWGAPTQVVDSSYTTNSGASRIDLCTWWYESRGRCVVFEGSRVAHCSPTRD